jgi:hypothetical protein
MDLTNLRFEYDHRLAYGIKNDILTDSQIGKYKEEYFHYRRRLLLGDSIRVTKDLLPNIYKCFQECLDVLGGDDRKGELYIHQSGEYNANVLSDGHRFDVLVNSGLVKDFCDEEICFVLGHELGHVIYQHDDIPVSAIVKSSNSLSEDAERVLYKWSRSAEISADRVGLLCAGSLESAVSALFKTSSGLTTIDSRIVINSYREQYKELKDHIERVGGFHEEERTHPMTSIRFKALEMASLDMVALRADLKNFSWDSFRKLDGEIANVIDGLEGKTVNPLVYLSSENGQIALFTALFYVVLISESISWEQRSFLHDVREILNSNLPLESMILDATASVSEFRKMALKDLCDFHDELSSSSSNQILKLCFLLGSISPNRHQVKNYLNELANAFDIEIDEDFQKLLTTTGNLRFEINRILQY